MLKCVNRAGRAVVLAVFVCLLCVCCMSSPAFADEPSPVSQITDEEIANALAVVPSPMARTHRAEIDSVQSFSGADRYETNALQALSGWTQSEWAIVTTGENWADALAASGLAGALDCPILLTKPDSLPAKTLEAIKALGVKRVIILGGTSAVSSGVESSLGASGVTVDRRLQGSTRYETQVEIFRYGVEKGFWEPGELVVACGADGCFADALSISPAAYAEQMPIFLTDGSGMLNNVQKSLLIESAKTGMFTSAVILGGEVRVSSETEGFLWGVVQVSCGKIKASQRMAGADRYATSVLVAKWADSLGYLSLDGCAFASGASPYDALGGGALQGRAGSVMLLVNDGALNGALSTLPKNSQMSSIKFFGGEAAVSASARSTITNTLGMDSLDVSMRSYSVSLSEAVGVEAAASSHAREDIQAKMDPSFWQLGDAGFYQFAVLSNGYSGAVTAQQLDSYLANMVAYQESVNGVTSTLRGSGAHFIAAAKTYGINEVYLLSHAAVESAWGTSTLAQGFHYDGITEIEGKTYPEGTYYNFFGIGAYDSSPLSGGRSMAVQQGWNSPEAAIKGGAEWISRNFVNPTVSSASISGAQDTLYKMRWDVARIENQGACWHQYATSLTWAEGIARVMSGCYAALDISIYKTGLKFEVPSYAVK